MPDWKKYVREQLPPLALPPEREAEIIEELAQHLEATYEEAVLGGASEEEARSAAFAQCPDWRVLECELQRSKRAFTGPKQPPESLPVQTGEKRRSAIWADFWTDLRYALRMMTRSPGFTMVAVLTLALGIGTNTAMFSIVNGVLLQPLPYPDGDQLVCIHTQRSGRGFGDISEPEFFDLLEGAESFQALGLSRYVGINLFEGEGEPEHVTGVRVTPDVFEALGIQPQAGRLFHSEEGSVGSHRVALLSDGLWRRRFGADQAVIGRSLRIRNDSYQIIGVMPEGFGFLYRDADIWIGYGLDRANLGSRGSHSSSIIARLREGVTVEEAQSELETLSDRLRQEHPNHYTAGSGFHFVAQAYLENMVGSVRPALLVLMGAVGLVLLIACVNVANLLLARITGREREIAIRAALGAGQGRILRQMLTECLLFGLLGGLGALTAAGWAFSAPVLLHPESLPRLSAVSIDTTVLAFNLGVVLFTTFAVGAIPAIRISRTSRPQNLKEGARQSDGAGRHKSRAVLVVTEVALATILMVGAGLLIRSFQQLLAVDPGFRADQILTTRLTLPADRYPDSPERVEFFRRLTDELAAQPGVISAAAVNYLPVSGIRTDWYLSAEGYEPADPNADYIQFRCVTPDYFETLGIPLLRGRLFTNHDTIGSQPVVILSESLARRFWGDEDPIGRRVRPGRPDSSAPWHVVVGIVGEVHHSGARQGMVPIWYRSAYQHIWSSMSLAVRTTGDPAQAIRVVKDAVGRIDPYQPVYRTQVMTEMVSRSLSEERFNTNLLIAFAGLALGLATIGIYGVIAYSVSRRTQEIGMRMALGAPRGRVLRDVLGEGLKLVLAGLGIGVVAALVLTRFLSWLLFGVEAHDPITFFAVVVVLGVTGLLACLLPARRAARVDPLVALRYE